MNLVSVTSIIALFASIVILASLCIYAHQKVSPMYQKFDLFVKLLIWLVLVGMSFDACSFLCTTVSILKYDEER